MSETHNKIKLCRMRQNLTMTDLPPMSQEEKEWWEEHNSEYYHYFYRIDNISNGKFYYGIHSQRIDSGKKPEDDGYMGSGTDLKKAQNEEGIENFKKTVVKTFSTRDEARLEEMMIVDEDMIKDPMCYNLALGGGCSGSTEGLVPVNFRDENLRTDEYFLISCEEYWDNIDKYIKPTSGKVIAREKGSMNYRAIPKEEFDKNRDLYEVFTDSVVVVNFRDPKLRKAKFFLVSKEEYKNNKDKYITSFPEFPAYKNKDNWDDIKNLSPQDPLVLSGQFIGIVSGVKQSQETINKKLGEKNGSYGTMWITNGEENKKIPKNNIIPEGWKKGRTTKSYRLYINSVSGEEQYFSDGEQGENFLPAIFFREGNMLTFEEINKKYNELGNWEEVCKFYHIKRTSLKEIRSFYESIGKRFKRK